MAAAYPAGQTLLWTKLPSLSICYATFCRNTVLEYGFHALREEKKNRYVSFRDSLIQSEKQQEQSQAEKVGHFLPSGFAPWKLLYCVALRSYQTHAHRKDAELSCNRPCMHEASIQRIGSSQSHMCFKRLTSACSLTLDHFTNCAFSDCCNSQQ